MAENEEEDVSIIVIEESCSQEARTGFPDLQIRFKPSLTSHTTNTESEIKQAHTALSTAYSSIKNKLSKVENENKGLKALLRKKEQDKMAVNNARVVTGSSHTPDLIPTSAPGLPVQIGNTNGSSILRRHSARLEGDQHRRHGSWAHFNDTADHGQYVKLMEMQIESTEKEKNTLKVELEQLRLRFTDHEMSTSKLKQDIARMDKENQLLRSEVAKGQQYAQRRTTDQKDIEELRKMNHCLQNQLKTAVDEYDRSCALNKQLEERLEHKIHTQEKQLQPRYESGEGAGRNDSGQGKALFQSMMNMTTSQDGLRLDSDDLSTLEYYIRLVKQQMSEVVVLKELAAQQNTIIADLTQKIRVGSEAQIKGSNSSLSVTMDPVPCEHDLQTRQQSLTNSHYGSNKHDKYNSSGVHVNRREITDLSDSLNHSKIPIQNSEKDLTLMGNENYSEPVYATTLQDPVFAVPPTIGSRIANNEVNPMNTNMHLNSPCRMDNVRDFGTVAIPPVSVGGGGGGMEVSDGGMFNNIEEGPPTMQYDESADFTIHHSNGEGQTLVKNIEPSTVLQLQQQAMQNRLQGWVPPPPNPHRTSSNGGKNSRNIKYPNVPLRYSPPNNNATTDGSLEEEVFDLNQTRKPQQVFNNTDPIIRQGMDIRDQYITSGNTRLSQSENLGRIAVPPTLSPHNSHETRCNQQSSIRPHAVLTPRNSDSGIHYIDPMQGMNNICSTHSNVVENRFRNGAHGEIPRPLNIERNIVTTKDLHPQSYDNRSGQSNVNINTNSPREKLPSSTTGPPGSYLNNQQVLGQKPGLTKNLESTYMTVKLPPVENTEELSDHSSEQMRTCPVCSYLFPVTSQEQQSSYEKHVEDCVRVFEPQQPPTMEDLDYRKCPMCQQTFDIVKTDQDTFEKHVQSHFNGTYEDITDRFEVLNL